MNPPSRLLSPLREAFAMGVQRALGLSFPPSRERELELGVNRAAAVLGETPASLLLRLETHDHAALAALAAELTIGETYFFRHPHHFAFLRRTLLALGPGRPAGDPIRLWSAGCSSGEEAYSMAITALEALGPAARNTVVVLATDINPVVLDVARAATYRDWSFRDVHGAVRERWFEATAEGLRVAPEPRAMVRVASLNLLGDAASLEGLVPPRRGFDVVFCRNVLIYFGVAAAARLTRLLVQALAPRGLIVPGPSDPLLQSPSLITRTTDRLIVYSRLEGVLPSRALASAAVSEEVPPGRAALHATPVPVVAASGPPARTSSPARPGAQASAELLMPSIAVSPAELPLDRARRLADRGETAAAIEVLDAQVAQHPLREDAYALRAVLHQALGDHARAAVDAERAIMLQRSYAFAHLLAATSRARLGERPEARRHVRNACKLLSALSAGAVPPGAGGASAADLLDACRRLDQALTSRRAISRGGGHR